MFGECRGIDQSQIPGVLGCVAESLPAIAVVLIRGPIRHEGRTRCTEDRVVHSAQMHSGLSEDVPDVGEPLAPLLPSSLAAIKGIILRTEDEQIIEGDL